VPKARGAKIYAELVGLERVEMLTILLHQRLMVL